MILMTTIRSFKTISTKAALILSNSIPTEMRAQKLATLSKLKRQTTKLHDPRVLLWFMQFVTIAP